jgi:ribosomal protein L16/L10AE
MLLLRSRWPNFEHETRIDEMDLEAALNFATNALSNAAQFWIQCSPEQNSDFKEYCFQMV